MKYGLQIIVPGANASESKLPKFVSYPRGFPSTNLKRLYLFDEGVVGQAYRQGFVDSSAEKGTGTYFLDSTAGTKSANGLIITDSKGCIINSHLAQPKEFTVVACFKHTVNVPGLGAGVTNMMWFSDKGNGAPANMSGSFAASPRPVPGVRLGNSNAYNYHALLDANQAVLGKDNQVYTEAQVGLPSNFTVMAFGVSVSLSRVALAGGAGHLHLSTRDDPDVATLYNAAAGQEMLVGLWPRGGLTATGELVGFAIYDKYLMADGSHIAPMSAMKAIAVGRGAMI